MRRVVAESSDGSRAVLAAVFVVAGVTSLVVVVPPVHFAYRAPGLHIALETAAAMIALLAAYLVLGRYRRSARIDSLALVCALWLFGLSNLLLGALPAAIFGARADPVSSWASVITATLGALIFMLAGYLRAARVAAPRRWELMAWGATTLIVAFTAIVVYLLRTRLPATVVADLSSPGQPRLNGRPLVLEAQLASMLAFAAAALAFSRRAMSSGDDLMRWFAVGSVFAAGSRLNYILYPSLYSQWVSIGDAFRLLFYFVLLLGAVREITRYWSSIAEAAVLEERRRIARDLHDGLAQELSFLVRRGRRLSTSGAAGASEMAASAARALVESRRAIAALTLPLDEPLEQLLARTLPDVGRRNGTRLVLELESVPVGVSAREALLRVASEAVWNAAQHAEAEAIHVRLSMNGGVRLEVIDDGRGFDVAAALAAGRGFGLTSMRERVAAEGGTFKCESRPGYGTRVEVVLP